MAARANTVAGRRRYRHTRLVAARAGGTEVVRLSAGAQGARGFSSGDQSVDAWLDATSRPGGCLHFGIRLEDRLVGLYGLMPVAIICGQREMPAIRLIGPAVDRPDQGGGLGAALLLDALMTAATIAPRLHTRVVVVQANSAAAAAGYRAAGFLLPADATVGVMAVADIRRTLQARNREADDRAGCS